MDNFTINNMNEENFAYPHQISLSFTTPSIRIVSIMWIHSACMNTINVDAYIPWHLWLPQCLALIQTKQCSHVHPILLCTKRCFPGSVTQCCSYQYTACRATCEMKNLGISFCVCLTVKSHFSCSQLITLHHRRSNSAPFGCLRRFYCFLIWGNSEAEKMLFLMASWQL